MLGIRLSRKSRLGNGLRMVVRNGSVLRRTGLETTDIRVEDGRVVEVGRGLGGDGIDAEGMLVLPGVVDAHVHFNEPGRDHWEGFATGSASLAAGGGTVFIDMPLNASPPTVDRESFELKRIAGEASSVLDFALWGGLVPGNADKLAELADCGVVGFKAFMIDSGTNDFPGVDSDTLRRGMAVSAALGLPVAVHAEDPAIVAERTAAVRAEGRRDIRAYLDSRPIESELEAVRVALDLAGETGCPLHVVHVSAPEAIAMISTAKTRGQNVTCEVCPHHVLLSEQAMFDHGAFAKCAPPLRGEDSRSKLWSMLLDGEVDCVGSDHSPAPPDMKTGDDFFRIWGGIMGCQHGFLLLLDRILEEAPGSLAAVWEAMTAHPAERFGLGAQKGRIDPGFDADLVLVSIDGSHTISTDELLYRHKTSPYVGASLRSRVARRFLRGQEVGLQPGGGRFLSRGWQ